GGAPAGGPNPAGGGSWGQSFSEPIQFGIVVRHPRQGHLTGECVLKLPSQSKPLLRRSWREIAEGTHDFLPRSLLREDGLDQKVIGGCSIFISAHSFSHIHDHYI